MFVGINVGEYTVLFMGMVYWYVMNLTWGVNSACQYASWSRGQLAFKHFTTRPKPSVAGGDPGNSPMLSRKGILKGDDWGITYTLWGIFHCYVSLPEGN